MSENFTPGPWDLETGVDGIVWVDGPATNICDLYHTDLKGNGKGELVVKPNAIANAHLIASSPDLFARLEEAIPFVASLRTVNAHQMVADMRAALAKARGES